MDRNLSFEEQLNKTLKKKAHAKINLLYKISSSPERAHCAFKITSAFTIILFGNLFSKFICKKPITP